MKAAFLVATHHRPQLLRACLETLKGQKAIPAGWRIDILVAGEPHDPGAEVAKTFGITFVPVNDPKVTVKLNALVKYTDADLVMLADDDDLQPLNRAAAAIGAFMEGYEWSGVRSCYFYDIKNDCLTFWEGDTDGLVGTSMSYATKLLQEVCCWPPIPNGKDAKIAYRIQRLPRKPRYKDLTESVGQQLVCLQHGANLWERPVLAAGRQMCRGRFVVRGKGGLAETPGELAEVLRKALAPLQKSFSLPPLVVIPPIPPKMIEKPKLVTRQIRVAITTYQRPDKIMHLLKDLIREGQGYHLLVTVYDDGSPVSSYKAVEQLLVDHEWEYIRVSHGGKRGYLELMTRVFWDASRHTDDYHLFLQDDMRLCHSFFERVLNLWETLPPKRATLLLFQDGRGSSWTNRVPVQVSKDIVETFWVDGLAFVFGEGLFLGLRAGFPMPPRYWFSNPLLGSGFGRQISQTLLKLNQGMYQTVQSYVVHAHGGTSKMNPEQRVQEPLLTKNYIDGKEKLLALEKD